MVALSRKSGVSLHHQLFLILRSGIITGRVREGDLLPSEEALVATYAVSRATVRRAMRTLETKGMIARFPGIGTRVLAPVGVISGTSAGIEMVGQASNDLVLSTIEFGFCCAPHDIGMQLELGADATVLKIVRLRRVGDSPVRITTHYIPEKIGGQITPDILGQEFLLDILVTLGFIGQRTVDTISAIIADAGDAALLGVEVGDPLLELTRLVRAKNARPIILQHSLVSPNNLKLRIESESDEEGLILVGGKGLSTRLR